MFTEKPKIDIFELKQRLIQSYDPFEIRRILMEIDRIGDSSYGKPLWQTNHSWEIPIPLQSAIASMPDNFLKDYSYILLAKSKELTLLKDFPSAKALLSVVEREVQHHAQSLSEKPLLGGMNLFHKLLKLLSWEALSIDICHSLHAWPATNICKYFVRKIVVKVCPSVIIS